MYRSSIMRLPVVLSLFLAVLGLALLAGCSDTSIPSGCTAVENFDVQRYLGKWYEVARLENSFEEGLTRCSADYSLKEDGRLQVVNRGWRAATGEWKEARGTGVFLDKPSVGSLRVSFFGPFWGGYHVLALDQENYRWALVAGGSREYLWILSREPQLDPEVLGRLKEQARALDFPVDDLVMVDQSDPAGSSGSGPSATGAGNP